MSSQKIKVHIADDHQILIDGIVAVLGMLESVEVVGHSLDGLSVMKWFEDKNADILILDIGMPKLDGIEVLKRFQEKKNSPDIIVLTSYNDVKLIKEVLKLGAKGFVTKISAGENIIEAIKTVQEGEMYFSKDIRNKIVDSFAGKKVNESKHFKEYFGMLSEREFEILNLIAEEYSNKEIAEKLFLSQGTVETHKKNIMTKLGVKNAMGLAIYLVKHRLVD